MSGMVRLLLRLPSRAATVGVARRALDSALAATDMCPHCRAELCLALSEACTNAVRHGGVDSYDVDVHADSLRCVIDVTDHGPGTDPAALDRPLARADQLGGRGFAMMRRLVDVVSLRSVHPTGTLVHLVKTLPPGPCPA